MRSCITTVVLLLLAFACSAAVVQAQKHHGGGGGGSSAPVYGWGWLPVTFDNKPKEISQANRRPKELNFRCKQACQTYQMRPILTEDGKPLCYFQQKRALGAPYYIYGTWYEGEESADWESTCRGRTETGAMIQEWATKWNESRQSYETGYACGCCGCISNCQNPNNSVNRTGPPPPQTPGCDNAFTVVPYSDTEPLPCPSSQKKFAICVGETAAFGWQWGTLLTDKTCTTYNALVADQPKAFCSASVPDNKQGARLDLLLGPKTPSGLQLSQADFKYVQLPSSSSEAETKLPNEEESELA